MNSLVATVAHRFEPFATLPSSYVAPTHVWTVRTGRTSQHRPNKVCSLLSIAIEDFPGRILCTFPTPISLQHDGIARGGGGGRSLNYMALCAAAGRILRRSTTFDLLV